MKSHGLRALVLGCLMVLVLSVTAFAEGGTGKVLSRRVGEVTVKVGDAEVLVKLEKGTKFAPEDFRPYRGDEIEFSGTRKTNKRSGNEYVEAEQVKAVKVDPRNTFTSPATGKVTQIGAGASGSNMAKALFGVGRLDDVRIYVDQLDDEISFERQRGTPSVENDYKSPSPGDKVRIFFNRIPARLGGGYAFILHGLQRMD